MEPWDKDSIKDPSKSGAEMAAGKKLASGSSYLLPPLAEADLIESLDQELGSSPLKELGRVNTQGVRLHFTLV